MIKKTYYIILLVALSALVSCDAILGDYEDEDADRIGISFDVSNNYPAEIEDAKIVIGGMDDVNTFIAIDTLILPTIKINNRTDQTSQFININENRWNPDFDRIKAIPSNAFFKIILTNGNNYLIKNIETSKLDQPISINLDKHKIVKNNIGLIVLSFDKDLKVTGYISDKE